MLCPNCAYSNLPTVICCEHCGEKIQSEEKAAEQQKLWDSLPEKARKEFEEKYEAEAKKRQAYLIWLNKNRIKHCIIGGIMLGIVGLLNGAVIISDILIGALAGLLLNHKQGGAYWGMPLFGGGYAISFVLKLALGLAYANDWIGTGGYGGASIRGTALFLMSGALIALCLGYGFGMHVEQKYYNRGM